MITTIMQNFNIGLLGGLGLGLCCWLFGFGIGYAVRLLRGIE